MSAASHDTRGRTIPEILGLAFGAIYLLVASALKSPEIGLLRSLLTRRRSQPA